MKTMNGSMKMNEVILQKSIDDNYNMVVEKTTNNEGCIIIYDQQNNVIHTESVNLDAVNIKGPTVFDEWTFNE